ncbi:MAG: hypothetical protein ACFFD4_13785 [Candidatus Odinarchaeota archaeon]
MSSSSHTAILRVSVISKKKRLTKLLKDKVSYAASFEFRFTGKPFGIREIIKENTGIDIRKKPFFPIEEDYHPVYPDKQRKQLMLEQATAIKRHFDNTDQLKIGFSALSYKQYFARADKPLLLSDFDGQGVTDDHSITVTVPRSRSIPEIQNYREVSCHENYIRLVNDFYKLVELICQQGNGFYLSE